MKKQSRWDIFVIGFALFALFFGAGNLIFPPTLGRSAGTNLLPAVAGFLLTGVGLPFLGIIAVCKAGGNIDCLARRAGHRFSKVLGAVLILTIGPFFAIPRTSATTFEMGILPSAPGFPSLLFSLLYFAVVLFFVLRPSKIIDDIGRYLTPALFITLMIIIIKGLVTPLGGFTVTAPSGQFTGGFLEGYQTMDAIGATIFGTIILSHLQQRGIKEPGRKLSVTLRSATISAVGLATIYVGLAYLGATASGLPAGLTRTQLVVGIAGGLLGSVGRILLGIAVGLACLTTAIGLLATTGTYFSRLFRGRLSYTKVCLIAAAISIAIANLGVDRIVAYAIPVLTVIYPVIMVLVILTLIDQYLPNKIIYKGAVYGALLVSLLEAGTRLLVPGGVGYLSAILPFAGTGFSWVLPAIFGGLLLWGLEMARDAVTPRHAAAKPQPQKHWGHRKR